MIDILTVSMTEDGAMVLRPIGRGAAAATPPTPPPAPTSMSAGGEDKPKRAPLYGFKAGLRKAFLSIQEFPVMPCQLMAQAIGKDSITDEEDAAMRPSFHKLGADVRKELAAQGIHFEPVWVDGEQAFRRKAAGGEMS